MPVGFLVPEAVPAGFTGQVVPTSVVNTKTGEHNKYGNNNKIRASYTHKIINSVL